MLTTVFDSFGYCRIGRLVAALNPIRRISRLTTTDSTGRLMKISVQIIAICSEPSVTRRVCRNRRRPVGGNRYRGSRLQLELTHRDHPITGLEATDDFRSSVEPVAGPHEGANGGQAGLAVIRLLLGEQENRISV